MIQAIPHRGPDDSGTWYTDNLGFGHVRLAIQDLSPKGRQPMQSKSGRFTIAYNGEVYNFQKLRKILSEQGHDFTGGSDTEVILATIECWGLEKALESFEGMFAFSLWDNQARKLTLCRDRMGEKPLYYGWSNGDFVWASELKEFVALSHWSPSLREKSITAYLKYGYVPTPYSIYQEIYKLPPGSYLTLDIEQAHSATGLIPFASDRQDLFQPCFYWNFADAVHQQVNRDISYNEAVDALDALLIQSTRDQMISDVPYGAFLSGGIDSSAVASVMQASSSRPIKTFTIGFNEADYNEAPFAADISRHLGTHHQELYISSDDCLQLVPDIASIMDEPFADSSVLPAYLVSKMARQHVTVCLSGDGGDELFCGYNRYIMPGQIERKIRLLPASMRRLVAEILLSIPVNMIDRIYRLITTFAQSRNSRVGLKVQKLAYLLTLNDPDQVYDMLISYCRDDDRVIQAQTATPNLLDGDLMARINGRQSDIERFMAADALTYLPDDNLTKVDRTSMCSSLETRLPLLNHKIVEFAWSLPLDMKYGENSSKRILRDVLYKRVPRQLIERPKMGFSVPIAEWLRGPLKGWGDDHISQLSANDNNHILAANNVRKLWQQHQACKRDHSAPLWNLLILRSWSRANNFT